MTTLTADQIASFRGDAGDKAATPDVTDAQLQAFYDKALTFGEDADTTYAITMVYYLRRLLGLSRKFVDARGEVEAESRGQYFEHIKDMLLPYWETIAGWGGGAVLQMGNLNLDLDYDEDDYEAEV